MSESLPETTMNSSAFSLLNLPPTFELPSCMEYFTLNAPPDTHIWRKPASRDTTTAPLVYTSLRHPFVIAEVTVTADWEMEWDQAGLVIFAGMPPGEQALPPPRLRNHHWSHAWIDPPIQGKWVKAGLEFTGGTLNASCTVATTPSGSDLSLSPISPISPASPTATPHEALPMAMSSLRIKFERIGDSLWVWYRMPGISGFSSTPSPAAAGAEWRKVREVMGFFSGVEDKYGVWVGCYASRPMNFTPSHSWEADTGSRSDRSRHGLLVEFEDLEIF
jgi:regulation of enolase protein 1 (concanavalin A-like superfamily)